MMIRTQWTDLTPRRRAMLTAVAAVELALTATAAVDLARRPAALLRGPKPLWWLAIFVQPIGPVAYLAWGRGGRGAA
jgi:hypothetical protein